MTSYGQRAVDRKWQTAGNEWQIASSGQCAVSNVGLVGGGGQVTMNREEIKFYNPL